MRKREWMWVGILIIVLFVLESIAVHTFYTSRFPGTSDFYPSWVGARALLLEGRDPYSPEVSAEIQAVLLGPNRERTISYSFAYPLHVIFLFWPLVYCSYDWSQAVWMVTLQWVVVATVIGLLRLERWRPSPIGIVGLLLAALAFYPVTRSVMLGQFTLHIALFLVAALLALQRGHDGWAGVWLAFTSIKPQMVVFVAPWLVLWAVEKRRWRFLGGLVAGGFCLLLVSLAVFPRWPLSFLEGLLRYSEVNGRRNPLALLMGLVWPDGPEAVRYVLAGFLVLAMLASWRRSWRGGEETFLSATHWSIVAGLLAVIQTGTTNQVMLLIPLFAWLKRAFERWRRWQVLIAVSGLLVALWVLFLGTIQGNYENPVMFLPLPLFSLAVLVGVEAYRR
jgi:hypothetical protein